MNLKGILAIGAAALITLSAPAAYAGFRHFHHHSNVVVSVGFGGFGFPGWGWGYGYPYYGYYPYGYGYYPYGYYPYGYSSYPSSSYSSYGYSSYRPTYRGQTANTSVVVQVQQRLARAGYYHGSVDGVIGNGTRTAIRAYERSHGLIVDGRIDRRLLATMGLA